MLDCRHHYGVKPFIRELASFILGPRKRHLVSADKPVRKLDFLGCEPVVRIDGLLISPFLGVSDAWSEVGRLSRKGEKVIEYVGGFSADNAIFFGKGGGDGDCAIGNLPVGFLSVSRHAGSDCKDFGDGSGSGWIGMVRRSGGVCGGEPSGKRLICSRGGKFDIKIRSAPNNAIFDDVNKTRRDPLVIRQIVIRARRSRIRNGPGITSKHWNVRINSTFSVRGRGGRQKVKRGSGFGRWR